MADRMKLSVARGQILSDAGGAGGCGQVPGVSGAAIFMKSQGEIKPSFFLSRHLKQVRRLNRDREHLPLETHQR